MIVRKRLALAAVTALACAGLVGTAPASADSPPKAETPAKVTIVTKGLNGPRQISAHGGYLYTAQSDTGLVTRVAKRDGAQKLQLSGITLPQGVVRVGGRLYVASGEPEPEPGSGTPSSGAVLLRAKASQQPTTFADLLGYELRYNPDNQTQFDEHGDRLDAIANPYYVVRSRSKGGFLLVANAGGNDIVAVSKKGTISTFFVPPSVTTGPCASIPNNSDAGPSCDAVPTGLAYGPDGNLYISAATSLVPGEGRVYVVDRNGKLLKTYTGFSGPTGVAVGPDGSVYVSEVLQGLPEGGPESSGAKRTARAATAVAADQLDPATVGQIVKVGPYGTRTYAQVTMPSGLLWTDGALYASAWSVAGELGIKDAGQIVKVDPRSFLPQ